MAIRKNINECFHFGAKKGDLLLTNEALQYYRNHQLEDDNWLYEENGLPVFLDTNVLLDLYRTSIRARDLFLSFINKNASRIVLTGQIQQEFMRHRVDKILEATRKNKSVKDDLNKLITVIECIHKDVIDRLTQWDNRSDTARDLKNVRLRLTQLKTYIQDNNISNQEEFKKLIKEVRDYVEPDFKDLEAQLVTEETDNVLESISKTQVLDTLTDDEKTFIFNLYDELWTKASSYETKTETRDIYAFPGRGDHTKKDNGEDPCGDLYIYHEMLTYIDEHDTDAIFLTGDVTKSDWIKSNGQPYIQYIIDSYANTKHIIHIRNYRDYNFGIYAGNEDAIVDANEDTTTTNNCTNSPEQPTIDTSDITTPTDNISQEEYQPFILNIGDYHTPHLRITEDLFMEELSKSLRWAKSYGNGYISMNFFIRDILGNKGFNTGFSYSVMNNLVKSNKIIIVQQEDDGHTFNSIQIVDSKATKKSRAHSTFAGTNTSTGQ